MQVKNDAAAAEADFAAVLAELEADQGDSVSEEAAPEAEPSDGDPEADEEESEETEEVEEPEASQDVESFKAELSDLLDGGDLKAVAEKLGLDPSIFKLNNKQFKAARVALRDAQRRETSALAAKAAADAAKADVEAKSKQAETNYGPIYEGFMAYKNGDPTGVRAAIEHMTGDKFENVVGAIARAAKGLDPGQIEVIKLRKELAARDAAKAKELEAQTAAQVAAQDISRIDTKLKGTSLEGVSGAADDIAKVMRASIDPRLGKPTKTLKEAFLEVKASYAKRAAELSKLTRRPEPEKKPERQPLAPRRMVPAAGKKLTPEQEFARELELAKKDTATAERKTRRVR